jgi:type VI secretion system secreted protein Hcp
MFLKLEGVTGETVEPEHQGGIDVVSWSWGMDAPRSAVTGTAAGKAVLSELNISKRVDQSSPTLMGFLRGNRVIARAQLTVRKAGSTPLTYFKIELENVRITSIRAESMGDELTEQMTLGFSKVRVSYIPQGKAGGSGGGANVFETDAHVGA